MNLTLIPLSHISQTTKEFLLPGPGGLPGFMFIFPGFDVDGCELGVCRGNGVIEILG